MLLFNVVTIYIIIDHASQKRSIPALFIAAKFDLRHYRIVLFIWLGAFIMKGVE